MEIINETMDTLVPRLYLEYGLYVNKNKMLPEETDGLLPVQKRVLTTAHLIARNKFVKTSKLLGDTMANFHPHSEAIGTAEWAVQNDLLEGDGQWGTKEGIEPISCSAPRYTSIKMNPFIESLAFQFIDHVVWEKDETDYPEPTIIPTMLPICFITKYETNTIAFGFKADIPCYTKKDLINRLLYLNGKSPKVSIKPYVHGCKVLSGDEECEKILTDGHGHIDIQGNFLIDEKNFIIYVMGWNPRMTFQNLFSKIDKYNKWDLISNKDIGFIDETTDKTGTKVRFELVKQKNREAIFAKMKEAITECLKSTVSYNIYVANRLENCIKLSSVDKMLMKSFNYFKDTLKIYMEFTIKSWEKEIKEYGIILKLRPHVSTFSAKHTDVELFSEEMSTIINEDKEDISSIIKKYRISRLLTVNLDSEEIQKSLVSMNEQLSNIDNVVISRYDSLKKSLN